MHAPVAPGNDILREQRHLSRINAEITRLEPQVRAVERVVRDLERKRKLVGTITGVENGALRPLPVLREHVTSKAGTTYAALTSMEASGVKTSIITAVKVAAARGKELGEQLGAAG